jgi:hypothetical protein
MCGYVTCPCPGPSPMPVPMPVPQPPPCSCSYFDLCPCEPVVMHPITVVHREVEIDVWRIRPWHTYLHRFYWR